MPIPFFHLYGLIIGLSVVLSLTLIEQKVKRYHIPEVMINNLCWWCLAVGVVCARAYHVMTDWSFYQTNLGRTWQVWNGGLSIIGAAIGVLGVLVAYFLTHRSHRQYLVPLCDILALTVPFGQAVGRLGNYFNQELYGLPTHLPWAIFIDPARRLPGYQNEQWYHPLFAYEMIGLVVFGSVMWGVEKKGKWRVGSGNYALAYILFYSLYRALLEFLRIDKTYFDHSSFGFNQVVLFIVFIGVATGVGVNTLRRVKHTSALQ